MPFYISAGSRKHGSPPVFKRIFYLPPAQAGASAANVGLASWVTHLGRSRWLPCSLPGSPADAPPTLVLSPSECVLPSAPGAASVSDMPCVRVSAAMVKVLAALPAAVTKSWQWGSVKPKPPLEVSGSSQQPPPTTHTRTHCASFWLQRLENLILVEIPECEASSLSLPPADADSLRAHSRHYDELVSLWRSLALAAQEKRLLNADLKKVQAVIESATAKGTRCVPGAERRVWSLSQCADIQAAAAAVAAAAASGRVDTADECLAAVSFHEAGLILDVGASSDWPLSEVQEGMRALLKPLAAATSASAVSAVSWFASNQPRSPSPLQLRCFSLGLWLIVKPKLGRDGVQPVLSEAAVSSASTLLESILPNLKVYCIGGPGIGSSAYPPRWLNVWKDETGDGVSPVLLDEAATNSGAIKLVSHTVLFVLMPDILQEYPRRVC